VFERGGASFAIGGTTCEYIERIAQRVGEDVAHWIWKEGARWRSDAAAPAPADDMRAAPQ
jgi:hypothetical protein